MANKAETAGQGTLVVMLHAFTQRAAGLAAVEQAVLEQWPGATIYRPQLPLGLFSMKDPNRIVLGLINSIDQLLQEAEAKGQPFLDIVLVGHSAGALLARKLYVVACGEGKEAPFDPVFREQTAGYSGGSIPPRSWAPKISRLVLLAGMNRRWRISPYLSFTQAFGWWLGTIVGYVLQLLWRFLSLILRVRGATPFILTIRRGAPFITQLRIQWLLMRRRAGDPKATGSALTVQLLGSRDDIVAPEDNIDLVSGGDFVYLDVPYSGHSDVVQLNDATFGTGRKTVFQFAISGDPDALREQAVIPSDENFSAPNMDVKQLVFVIHGIRDVGYWTHKLARRVKQRAGNKRNEWATETSSYGYFPMLPFVFPWYRRQKVEWFMDQYAQALARYPNASFSYIGHSNGTYLLAKALEIYPCCHFRHVVFAGSVVRRGYDWRRLLSASPPRVEAVLNFVATSDWVVAVFPKFFQWARLQDLGSAGHDGFALSQTDSGVHEITYVKGGHSAAIQEHVWDIIADFVVTGKAPLTELPYTRKSRNLLVTLLGKIPFVVCGIPVIVVSLWFGIEKALGFMIEDSDTASFAAGVALSAYALSLWLAVTKL